MGRGALDGEVPDRVAAGLPVGRPDHFDVEPAMNFVTVSELVYRVVHQRLYFIEFDFGVLPCCIYIAGRTR